jgi:cation:H+ antiporter
MDLVLLLISFAVIVGGAMLFTNGVEWFGRKLELGEGAVGSVLAAVGTALPETTIPVIAILFSPDRAETSEVGLGAILGAPFMLATLALFVAGLAASARGAGKAGGDEIRADRRVLVIDLRTFVVAYALAIASAVVLPGDATIAKAGVAAVLILLYARYVKRHFEAEAAETEEDPEGLHFHRFDRAHIRDMGGPPRVLIVVGAMVFIWAISDLSRSLGVSEILLALIVAPIATELPEGSNSVLWIRQGKDTLALGNITGAMVFQAAIPTSIALVFAPATWVAGPGSYLAFASAAVALLSAALLLGPSLLGRPLKGRRLLLGGALYAAYLAVVLFGLAG